jgi:hypothetical protein
MAKLYLQITVFVAAAVFLAACGSAPTPTSPPTAMPPTPLATVWASTNPLPTVTLTAVPPTPTALPATPTNSPSTVTPTAVPPTPTNTATAVPQTETVPETTDSMKIRITRKDTVLTATLVDSQTAQDFISLLPLTLTLGDYGSTEKISDLPRRLSTEDAPEGIDPSIGDITYYAPWGNLAIFIRDFGYASGLVLLGKIDGDIEALNVPGSINVTIELIE